MYRDSQMTLQIEGCTRSGQEEEYLKLIKDYVTWCDSNHLLNTINTREIVKLKVDY